MNILVVRTDKLGDFVTALPTLFVLKQHNPDHKIIACVASLNRQLALACPFIDEVIVDDGGSLWGLVSKLREAEIDVSITLFSNTRVAMAQFLAGIALRIAPATKLAQVFYNRRVQQRRSRVEMAEFEYNLQLAKTLFSDIDLSFAKPLCRFSEDEITAAYRKFCDRYAIDRAVVAFHPGFGGSSDANWTLEEYIELVKIASDDPSVQAVMTFGPGEDDLYARSVELCEGMDVIFYKSQEGIVEFTKLLASFKLFVSTSTGTYHLAALVNT
ncbi:MAG: glycosyltransferase family 9 protein, partial [Campylobacterota bacterium]